MLCGGLSCVTIFCRERAARMDWSVGRAGLLSCCWGQQPEATAAAAAAAAAAAGAADADGRCWWHRAAAGLSLSCFMGCCWVSCCWVQQLERPFKDAVMPLGRHIALAAQGPCSCWTAPRACFPSDLAPMGAGRLPTHGGGVMPMCCMSCERCMTVLSCCPWITCSICLACMACSWWAPSARYD